MLSDILLQLFKMKILAIFLSFNVVYGEWHQGKLEKVKASHIDSTLKDISPIQCQLRCNRVEKCTAIAYTYSNVGVGKLVNCFFLKDLPQDASVKTVELFVIRKVIMLNF